MPLKLQGLTRNREDGSVALHAVDLEVEDGEILVVAGPAGGGKSTLLRLLAGRLAPTAGTVERPGGKRRAAAAPVSAPRRAGTLLLTSRTALPSGESLRASLSSGLVGEPLERALTAAERLGLGDRLALAPAALSAGERQAALLARAVARAPALLLLDDTLGPMDPGLRARARVELAAAGRAGTTVLLAASDPAEALRMGGRAAVLGAGRLLQVAPAETLYERPATVEVAAFFGVPPMNLFPGTLVAVENGVRFRGTSFTLAVAPLDPPGEDVVLGVRPEHVLVVGVKPDRAGSPDALATVRRVEPLGAGALLHCRSEQGEELIARTHERPEVQREQLVGVRIDRAHLHLFDRRSGERVAQPPAVGERWWVG